MAESSRADALAQARRMESAGRAEGSARAFAAAGAVADVTRVMRSAGRLDLAVRILTDGHVHGLTLYVDVLGPRSPPRR